MEIKVNNTFFTGKFLIHLPSVDSTNNYAKQCIAKSSPIDGTVILADEQFAGRGQAGNVWQSDANKNLTFSIIYKTSFLQATEQFYLNMAVSLGIQQAISADIRPFSSAATAIKWPNDIYSDDRKIAGILIENSISGMYLNYSVIGIGLNVNQETFPEGIRATSLKLIANLERDVNNTLSHLLASVEHYFLLLKERKFERLKKEYVAQLYRRNIPSGFLKDGKEFIGSIADVDEYGNLMMETADGIRHFGFKEIAFL